MTQNVQPLWDRFLADRSAAAKRELVLQYLDLVRYVVARLHRLKGAVGGVLEQDDMVQYGVLGLLDAIDRFSPSAGVKFETYAIPRIRGAILDEIRKLDWVPRSVRANVRRVEAAVDRMVQEVGREPAEQEIAGKLALSVADLQKILKEVGTVMAGAVRGRAGDADVLNQIAEETADPLERLTDDETTAVLVAAIRRLPERSRKVIALYYYEGLRFGEIGRMLGVSESRVSQIHSEVLRDLRGQLAGFI